MSILWYTFLMKDVVELLLKWYLKNKRELPWRKDTNPYHVWISEIMLQQTRIEAVIEYYERFMKRVPTIQDLNEISEDELLKLWEGLGYYSRARNLKKAAELIMNQYHGIFPSEYSDILSLPGIGEYTAGAISSICFQQKEVAIDGNVMRVYIRVEGKDLDVGDLKVKKKIGEEIQKILPEDSGSFNQALMELGEIICIPGGIPKCEICPIKDFCKAHLEGKESLIPKKIVKKEKSEEVYTVFLIYYHGLFALRKRESGLLKNLWEFPNVSGHLSKKEVEKMFSSNVEKGISYTHIFTHKKWKMKSYLIESETMDSSYIWVSLQDIQKSYAIPTAFHPFLESLKTKYPQ